MPAALWGWLPCLQPVTATMALVQIRGLSSVPATCFKACLGSGLAPHLESSSLWSLHLSVVTTSGVHVFCHDLVVVALWLA